ncbi:MAG: hypothetical protein V2A54_17490 [Bacteroidota bacterium]
MVKITKIIICFFVLCLAQSSFAQNGSAEKAYYYAHLTATDVQLGQMDAEFLLEVSVIINDPTINKIHVKIFSSVTGSINLSQEFLLSGQNTLPEGITFMKNGNTCTMALGKIAGIESTIEIRTENSSGIISDPIYEHFDE